MSEGASRLVRAFFMCPEGPRLYTILRVKNVPAGRVGAKSEAPEKSKAIRSSAGGPLPLKSITASPTSTDRTYLCPGGDAGAVAGLGGGTNSGCLLPRWQVQHVGACFSPKYFSRISPTINIIFLAVLFVSKSSFENAPNPGMSLPGAVTWQNSQRTPKAFV